MDSPIRPSVIVYPGQDRSMAQKGPLRSAKSPCLPNFAMGYFAATNPAFTRRDRRGTSSPSMLATPNCRCLQADSGIVPCVDDAAVGLDQIEPFGTRLQIPARFFQAALQRPPSTGLRISEDSAGLQGLHCARGMSRARRMTSGNRTGVRPPVWPAVSRIGLPW